MKIDRWLPIERRVGSSGSSLSCCPFVVNALARYMTALDTPRIRWLTWKNGLILAGLLCFGLPLLYGLAYSTGEVYGEEFCPDTFSRRVFDYNRPSWLPVTLRGIRYRDNTPGFVSAMIKQKWIAQQSPTPQRWDLVRDNRMPDDSTAYDARMLCRYLDMQNDDGSPFWLDWNRDHQTKAAILWPWVARLAQRGDYYLIPGLMELAMSSTDLADGDFAAKLEAGMLVPAR